jgi:hypothetical protein
MCEKRKGPNTRQTTRYTVSARKRIVADYVKESLNEANRSFHLKLKHFLGILHCALRFMVLVTKLKNFLELFG